VSDAETDDRRKEVQMIHGIEAAAARFPAIRTPPRPAQRRFDAQSELTAELTPAWQVEQAVDYVGEVSYIALPVSDDPDMAAFILYERGGRAHIATIQRDEWQNGRSFATLNQAVNALIARAGTCQISHG
jgi:hypothetical protein